MIQTLADSMRQNRELVHELTLQELRRVNYGSVLGLLWLVLNPLLQALIYIIVLGIIFPIRLGINTDQFDFARYVVSGFLVWHMITSTLGTAPALFLSRAHLLRYVPYPVELLPLPTILVSLIGGGVMLVVYLLMALFAGTLEWTILLLPVPVMILVAFLVGASWLLMILGVFLRDIGEITRIVLMILLYVSPILFAPQTVGPYWKWILLNPLSHIIVIFRDVLYATWHPGSWIIAVTFSAMTFFCGVWVMKTARRGLQNFV